jgi:hypothetical protein
MNGPHAWRAGYRQHLIRLICAFSVDEERAMPNPHDGVG